MRLSWQILGFACETLLIIVRGRELMVTIEHIAFEMTTLGIVLMILSTLHLYHEEIGLYALIC